MLNSIWALDIKSHHAQSFVTYNITNGFISEGISGFDVAILGFAETCMTQ